MSLLTGRRSLPEGQAKNKFEMGIGKIRINRGLYPGSLALHYWGGYQGIHCDPNCTMSINDASGHLFT